MSQTPAGYIIPADLANQVVEYLSDQPYKSVSKMIAQLVQLKPLFATENQTGADAPPQEE